MSEICPICKKPIKGDAERLIAVTSSSQGRAHFDCFHKDEDVPDGSLMMPKPTLDFLREIAPKRAMKYCAWTDEELKERGFVPYDKYPSDWPKCWLRWLDTLDGKVTK